MKSKLFAVTLVALSLGTGVVAFQQGKPYVDCVSAASNETAVTGNLIGTTEVKASRLVGEWGSVQGVAAYSNKTTLKAAGQKKTTDALSGKITQLIEQMEVKDASVSFAADGTFKANGNGDVISGTYKVNKNLLTMTSADGKSMVMNVKMSGKKLQVFLPLTQCPQSIRQQFANYSTEGLYLGVQFVKN